MPTKTSILISDAITELLGRSDFRRMAFKSLTDLRNTLVSAMGAKCSESTAHDVATTLSRFSDAEDKERLSEALSYCPEWVALSLPAFFQKERLEPGRHTIFFLAKEIMYSAECVLAALNAVLDNPDPANEIGGMADEQRVRAAFETARMFGQSPTSRVAPDWKKKTVTQSYVANEVLDAYEQYQIFMLEGEGGICRD